MSYATYGFAGLILWLIGIGVYNVFFHSLSAIPGPFFAKISRWWLFKLEMRGNPHMEILDLHRKYGMFLVLQWDIGARRLLTDNRINTENLTQ